MADNSDTLDLQERDMLDMLDELDAPATESANTATMTTATMTTATGTPESARALIRPWMLLAISAVLLGAWGVISFWLLNTSPSEAERTQILTVAQNLAVAAASFWLGSSVGSQNARGQI